MNLNSKSILNKLHYGDEVRPVRDWLVLLGIFIIGLALCLIYSLMTFSKVVKGQPVGNAMVAVPVEIKLDQVTALFEARAAARARYGSEYRFVDPSL